VVGILFEILSHIVSVRKEVESVIKMVKDKKLKKNLKGFIVSCVFLSGILKLEIPPPQKLSFAIQSISATN
jgi:hypothetical protein